MLVVSCPFSLCYWQAEETASSCLPIANEYGYRALENKKTIYELHATILHLLGLDDEKLTYRFNGREMRLTDVPGRVIREILA